MYVCMQSLFYRFSVIDVLSLDSCFSPGTLCIQEFKKILSGHLAYIFCTYTSSYFACPLALGISIYA